MNVHFIYDPDQKTPLPRKVAMVPRIGETVVYDGGMYTVAQVLHRLEDSEDNQIHIIVVVLSSFEKET